MLKVTTPTTEALHDLAEDLVTHVNHPGKDPIVTKTIQLLHPYLQGQLAQPTPIPTPSHVRADSPTPSILTQEEMMNPLTTHATIVNNIRLNGFGSKFPPKWQKLSKVALIELYLTHTLWNLTDSTPDWCTTCKKCEDSVITCSCYPP